MKKIKLVGTCLGTGDMALRLVDRAEELPRVAVVLKVAFRA